MENLDELTRQVLDLPLDQRSALAEKLLESLDELAPAELGSPLNRQNDRLAAQTTA